MNEPHFNIGAHITLLPEFAPKTFDGWKTRGGYGRLDYGQTYEVKGITKQGHIMVDTKWGKMFYSKKLFKVIS